MDLLDPTTRGHFDQGIITIVWLNPDGSKGTTFPSIFNYKYNSLVPYLPGGYCIELDPYTIKDNNGNNGIVKDNSCSILINLNAKTTDTLTFQYSWPGLKELTYNKAPILPPNNMDSYPVGVPVVIRK